MYATMLRGGTSMLQVLTIPCKPKADCLIDFYMTKILDQDEWFLPQMDTYSESDFR